MKKLLVVTGGAGFVGSNLIRYLLKKTSFRIISIDNYSSGSKSNHATVVKYVAAELQKCNIGDSTAMKDKTGTDKLTCSERKTAGKVSEAAAAALSEFKNAYGTVGGSALGIFDAAAFAAKANCTSSTEGRTNVKSTTTQVTVSTCIADGEDPLNDTLLIE